LGSHFKKKNRWLAERPRDCAIAHKAHARSKLTICLVRVQARGIRNIVTCDVQRCARPLRAAHMT